jgi:uncharacterized protein (DUF1697 family)
VRGELDASWRCIPLRHEPGSNRRKLTGLRDGLEVEGFASLGTLVACANVLFGHARAADLKLDAGPIAENPFAGDSEERFVNTRFLEKRPTSADFARLEKEHEGRGDMWMAAGTRALHIDFLDGIARSKLTSDFIARRTGCRGTARNLRSMKRILEQMD